MGETFENPCIALTTIRNPSLEKDRAITRKRGKEEEQGKRETTIAIFTGIPRTLVRD